MRKKTSINFTLVLLIFIVAQSRETLRSWVIFMYYALDDYSQFLIDLGFADNISDDTILHHIKKLMKHKDFKSSPKKPFTLMSSCGQDIEDKIIALIKPHKGKLIINTDTVIEKTQNVIDYLKKQHQ